MLLICILIPYCMFVGFLLGYSYTIDEEINKLKGGQNILIDPKELENIRYKLLDIKNNIDEKLREIELLTQELNYLWLKIDDILEEEKKEENIGINNIDERLFRLLKKIVKIIASNLEETQ